MKKKNTLVMLLATMLFSLFAVSCQPEDDIQPDEINITLSQTSLEFDSKEQKPATPQITVTTNAKDWEVTDNAEWLDAKRQGDGIIITSESNSFGKTRVAEVLVFAGGVPKKITVTQSSADLILELSPTDFAIPKEGGKYMIDINSNSDSWRIDTEEEISWLHWRKLSNGQLIELIAEKNLTSDERKAQLYVISGDIQKQINIVQASGVLGNNVMPLLKSLATAPEINEFETNRGSQLLDFSGALPKYQYYTEKYEFLTLSPVFRIIRYERSIDDGRLNLVTMESGQAEYVTSEEFKEFLIENGFTIDKWEPQNKKFEGENKDLQYKFNIEVMDDGYSVKVNFKYYAVQKVHYETFSEFPYYNSNMLLKKNYEEVNKWELEQGSTLVKTNKSKDFPDEIATALYMKDTSNSPLFSTFYHFLWDKDLHTGKVSEIWFSHNKVELAYWDSSENKTHKWVLTNEFTELIEKEGFVLFGATESGWPAYVKIEKNLIFLPIVGVYKDLNDGKPVLEIVFNTLDPTASASLGTEDGRARILKELSMIIKRRQSLKKM
ncbi:BACON domain-containing protein [Porphyromonadaceae bacterium W3.11]|nr:BACON domain-containing protein [Porphyromonadaceae bacterium W3.11]